ncbi:YtrH family sporulation protein [Gottfriedia acidiceleris]|uniref:YtrH family sporulation protein n=2 Tax=Bacillaceae TaxID=186817 RepID=UPI00256FD524|nr:YtrH family sporulation protein [Bacillus sp. AFS001701]
MELKLPFIPALISMYFISLGIIIGGSIIGSIGYYIIGQPPLSSMYDLSMKLRIWAIVGAIGGTFDTFYSFEKGLFEGETIEFIKQIFMIIAAMGGTHTGTIIIQWFTGEHV